MMKVCIECGSESLIELPCRATIRNSVSNWTEYWCQTCGHQDHETDQIYGSPQEVNENKTKET